MSFPQLQPPSTPSAQPPRPLRRSRSQRMVGGVIGGFAEFFGLDATLLRAVYVVGSILSAAFPGLLVYLVLWLVIPPSDA